MKTNTEETILKIKADDRLPLFERDITPAHLPIFEEWQRIADKELGRTPPTK